ncbi:MAG: isoprenyl transferase [Desulfatiglandales bacterium]|jgi:undecaprenyl diphosphate synthase
MINGIDPAKLPNHVAVIMDGNGRWAKKRGLSRIQGHEEGAESVRAVVKAGREVGIRWLTLYAFSEENWKRPKYEIEALMGLLKRFLKAELKEMLDNGIRLQYIGRVGKLPRDVQQTLRETEEQTRHNADMVLTLALSYGGRQEITDALSEIAKQIESGALNSRDVSEELIMQHLYTAQMPDPDLLIRTSGEYRVSNFLLWQIAYAEIFTTPVPWPDFRREEFVKALKAYQRRERRYGAVSEE